MTRVLVFGVFDFFHPGHVGFLRMAANQGNELIVSVARDEFVTSFKKKTPMFTEKERRERIAELDFVSRVVLSDRNTGTYSVISEFMPNLVCFGHDQHQLQEHCENWLAANDLPVKTMKLDFVKHIKKDYAFLRPDRDLLSRKRSFSALAAFCSDSQELRDAYCVYNRNSELKAVIVMEKSPGGADISVYFENSRNRQESDHSLLRETAYFLKFLKGLEKTVFNIAFPAVESGGPDSASADSVEISVE
jgi:cytidyltransferase-like protein